MNRCNNGLFVLALLVISATTNAQTERPNVFKLDALSIFISEVIPYYEFALNTRESIQIGVPLSYSSRVETLQYVASASQTESLIGVNVSYRKYLVHDFPESGYLSPSFEYRQMKGELKYVPLAGASATVESGSTSSIGGSLVLGYQWHMLNHLTLDLYWGAGYYVSEDLSVSVGPGNQYEFDNRYKGARLKLGFLVGYCF